MLQLRDWAYEALNTYAPFQQFGMSHLWAVLVCILLAITVPRWAKHNLQPQQQQWLGSLIGCVITGSYFVWILLKFTAGTFNPVVDLPLQLCQFSNLLAVFVMVWRSKLVFDVLYFWAFSGMLQATITPDLQADFPNFLYFRYWIGHPGVLIAIVYACVVYGLRPTWASMGKAFVAMLGFLALTTGVNLLLGSNYFWICGKPEVPSLLDYLGPWPWYILSGTGVAMVHFLLSYLPFWVMDNRKKMVTA